MSPHQIVNQDSGDVEFFTPDSIICAARQALGGVIDLDPASCEIANTRVMALSIFTKENNGLVQHWRGRIWMNHPFAKGRNHLWINKLVHSFESGEVSAACCITYAATSERWFQPLIRQPQCFLFPRTNYLRQDGSLKTGVTKGSVVTYFGKDIAGFQAAFARLGCVKIAA